MLISTCGDYTQWVGGDISLPSVPIFLCLVLILKKKYELFGFVFIHVTGKDDITTYEKRSTTIVIII